jgi:hypothetical protein
MAEVFVKHTKAGQPYSISGLGVTMLREWHLAIPPGGTGKPLPQGHPSKIRMAEAGITLHASDVAVELLASCVVFW